MRGSYCESRVEKSVEALREGLLNVRVKAVRCRWRGCWQPAENRSTEGGKAVHRGPKHRGRARSDGGKAGGKATGRGGKAVHDRSETWYLAVERLCDDGGRNRRRLRKSCAPRADGTAPFCGKPVQGRSRTSRRAAEKLCVPGGKACPRTWKACGPQVTSGRDGVAKPVQGLWNGPRGGDDRTSRTSRRQPETYCPCGGAAGAVYGTASPLRITIMRWNLRALPCSSNVVSPAAPGNGFIALR